MLTLTGHWRQIIEERKTFSETFSENSELTWLFEAWALCVDGISILNGIFLCFCSLSLYCHHCKVAESAQLQTVALSGSLTSILRNDLEIRCQYASLN